MTRIIIPYKPYLKGYAKKLRQNMTRSEILLWNQLKQKKMCGMDFDRQRPILNYIVDFYCKDLMLAIEVDGSSHYNNEQADCIRQIALEAQGVRFIRFDDLMVKRDMKNVLAHLESWVEAEIKENGFVGRIKTIKWIEGKDEIGDFAGIG